MNPGWSDPILTCAEAKALEARLFGGDEAREWTVEQIKGLGEKLGENVRTYRRTARKEYLNFSKKKSKGL